ncbi:MAG TPA: polysaccharide deacetylase family protein [Burkholderiaceae bacterium]|nr:polysaccharide deacetylase family protein [Burkholderiaceae bacterium]
MNREGRAAHLCVAVHDVAPATWADCERVLQTIAEVADVPMSLLAVPRYHGAPHSRDFEHWLRWRASEGDELVLHGYTHLDDGAPRSPVDRWRRHVYTQGEGEFCALDEAEASRRLLAGAQWFRSLGVPLHGFVAPAWLLGRGGWAALRRFGLRYTCTLSHLVLLPERHALFSQSLVYSARSEWRRAASIEWNRLCAKAQARRPLLRLELHPHDADDARMRTAWQRLLEAALRDRTAVTLAQAAERFRLDEAQRALGGEKADRRADHHVARVVQAEHHA